MSHIKVFDPAVCCSSGGCGPDDVVAAQFSAALDKAKRAGNSVDRFTLGHQPGEYVKNAVVKSLLDKEGIDVLPIVFLDDQVLSKGRYPSHDDLLARLALSDQGAPAQSGSSCCGPSTSSRCCS